MWCYCKNIYCFWCIFNITPNAWIEHKHKCLVCCDLFFIIFFNADVISFNACVVFIWINKSFFILFINFFSNIEDIAYINCLVITINNSIFCCFITAFCWKHWNCYFCFVYWCNSFWITVWSYIYCTLCARNFKSFNVVSKNKYFWIIFIKHYIWN